MMEQPPQAEKPKALDEQWHAALELATKVDPLKSMDGIKANRDKTQAQFMNGEVINPTLDYRVVTADQKMAFNANEATKSTLWKSPEDLLRMEENLLILKKRIRAEEKIDAIKRAYCWKINEKIAELRMLKQMVPHESYTKAGRKVEAKSETERSRRFSRYSEYIYGKPSPAVFAYTIQEMTAAATAESTSENDALKEAAQDVLASMPDISAIPYKAEDYTLPGVELVADISTKTKQEMGALIAHVPQKPAGEKMLVADIVKAMDGALQELKAGAWTVISDVNRQKMVVSQGTKTVTIPASRTGTTLEIQKLVAHEVGTHVARRLNGDRSGLMLLGTGLDRYAKAEEGVATLREQGVEGKVNEFPRLEYHLAVSLAKGVDGKPRDFRGVYELMEKWIYFKKLNGGATEEQAKKDAATEAYDHCVSTFRGTDAKTPGACFTKEIVYREGNIKVWRFLGKNPNDIVKLSLGKFDQSNDRHMAILIELGITDEDLETLEQTEPE